MKNLSNENIIHIKDNNIEYIQFKELLKYKNKIQHCYTLKGNNNDYKQDDGCNYKELYKSLDLDYKGLRKIENQIHSDLIQDVINEDDTYTKIDGLLSDKKDISLSLRFADCTPIFLYDKEKNIIGNIHSGWRGTVQKIGQKAVIKMMEDYKSKPEDIIACIGPCIQMCHFKVDKDVKDIFEKTFSYMNINDLIIKKGSIEDEKQKYYIDATLINIKLLEEAGLKKENIINSNICTACNYDIIHSYRIEKENAGRNTSIIGLI